MKKKIAEEIEKLKQLEEEKTAKLKLAQSFEPKQPSITPQHEQAPPVPEPPTQSPTAPLTEPTTETRTEFPTDPTTESPSEPLLKSAR